MPPQIARSDETTTVEQRDTRAWLESQWAVEPQVSVYVEPDADEERAAQENGGVYPPRMYQINGVTKYWRVGEENVLPRSHAVLYSTTKRRLPYQGAGGVGRVGILPSEPPTR